MTPTPGSLLQRLKEASTPEAWERLVDLYTPLIYLWASRMRLQAQDTADLVQEVLLTIVQKLPELTVDPNRNFRGWLKTVTMNRWRDLLRRRQAALPGGGGTAVEDVAVPDSATQLFEKEYRQYL